MRPPVPDQFVADMRARGRRSLTDSSRAIDDYLRTAPLAARLTNLSLRTELVFGEHDARVVQPRDEFSALCRTRVVVLPGVGRSPPWEAPDKIAHRRPGWETLKPTPIAKSRSAAATSEPARAMLPEDPGYERRWTIVDTDNKRRYTQYRTMTERPIAIVELLPTN